MPSTPERLRAAIGAPAIGVPAVGVPAIGVRLAWALILLLVPGRPGRPDTAPIVAWSARALVARHLTESLVLARRAPAQPPAWTVWVDAVHAATMVAVTALSRRLRPDALISALAATAIASVSELGRRTSRR